MILLIFILSGSLVLNTTQVDTFYSFDYYKNEFILSANKNKAKLDSREILISFDDQHQLTDTQLGLCSHNPGGVSKIIIKRRYWDTTSIYDRRQLIFHELGHCWLDLKHDNEFLSNGVEASLMYFKHINISRYNRFTSDYYETQLFSKYLQKINLSPESSSR